MVVKRSRSRSRSTTRSPKRTAQPKAKQESYGEGTNWTEGGVGQGTLFMPALMVGGPVAMLLLAYITSEEGKESAELGLLGNLQLCVTMGAW